jgi:DNA-binding NarL/FixJ family response regulator
MRTWRSPAPVRSGRWTMKQKFATYAMGARIETVLASANHSVLDAITAQLDLQADLEVVGTATTWQELAAHLKRTNPQVVLLDLSLATVSGNPVRELLMRAAAGQSRVIALAPREDPRLLQEVVEGGGFAYVTIGEPASELVDVIRTVQRGETVVPQSMLGELIENLRWKGSPPRSHASVLLDRLSPRQGEVLQVLADGGDTKAIAAALSISLRTAQDHLQKLVSKLGVVSPERAAALLTQAIQR